MSELIRGDVRVEFENIGEGWSGEYNDTDPDDEPLLRFYVSVKRDGTWEDVEDASYCTRFPATATEEQQQAALAYLMDKFYEPVVADVSVKKLGERLSWIDLSWLDEEVSSD